MKIRSRILPIFAIIVLSFYKGDVNCLDLPSFAEIKRKVIKKIVSWDYRNSRSPGSRIWEKDIPKAFLHKTEEPKGLKGWSFKKIYSKLSDPLTKDFPPNFRRNYAYFLLFFSFLVLYAVVGCQRNKRLANRWANEVLPVLDDNFAYVERDHGPLDVKGWNNFEMYASGRTSCKGFLMKLDFVKRQCFWQENFLRFVFPHHDTVEFESQFETLDPFLLAVCLKLENKEFIRSYPHILHFSTIYEPKDFPERFRVYVSSTDKSVLQFVNYILNKLQPFVSYMEFFYVSDLLTVDSKVEKKPFLCCRFKMPKKSTEYAELAKTIVNFIDCSKNFTLHAKLRDTVAKDRADSEAIFNRLNKSFREEQPEEKTELTPEKTKKLEERMARKSKPLTNFKIKKIK